MEHNSKIEFVKMISQSEVGLLNTRKFSSQSTQNAPKRCSKRDSPDQVSPNDDNNKPRSFSCAPRKATTHKQIFSTPKKRSMSCAPKLISNPPIQQNGADITTMKRKTFANIWDIDHPYRPIQEWDDRDFWCSTRDFTRTIEFFNKEDSESETPIPREPSRNVRVLSGDSSIFIPLQELFQEKDDSYIKIVVSDEGGDTVLEEKILLSPQSASPKSIGHTDQFCNTSVTSSLNSSGYQFCRICHDHCSKEALISPCNCSGSLAMVHKSCLEKWLSSRGERCEICLYKFPLLVKSRSFIEYLFQSDDMELRRSLRSDLMCFFILTPLVILSTYFCLTGASLLIENSNNVKEGKPDQGIDEEFFFFNETTTGRSVRELRRYIYVNGVKRYQPETDVKKTTAWQSSGLIMLSILLLFVYLPWMGLSIRYQISNFRKWRTTYRTVSLQLDGRGSS